MYNETYVLSTMDRSRLPISRTSTSGGPDWQARLRDKTRIRTPSKNLFPATRVYPTGELWSAERGKDEITPEGGIGEGIICRSLGSLDQVLGSGFSDLVISEIITRIDCLLTCSTVVRLKIISWIWSAEQYHRMTKLTRIWYDKRKIMPGRIRQPRRKLTPAPGELRRAVTNETFSCRQMRVKWTAENTTI
jgi:hypothetical protein